MIPPGIIRLIFPKVAIILISFFAALVFSEVMLRMFWKPAYLDPQYRRDDFSWMSKNVVLNNFGYRDKDTALFKNLKTIRIYSLGDSFTYGWYIDNPNLSYPNILESRLQERFGKEKLEVINASQPGFKIHDSLERFRSEGILFSSDVVTLGINPFDFTASEFAPKRPKLKFLADLRLYGITFGNLGRARITNHTKKELADSLREGSGQFIKNLEEIKNLNELVTSSGGVLVLIVFPEYDSFNPNKPYLYREFHESIKKIASNHDVPESGGIIVVDLLEEFERVTDKRVLVLNPTDNHPTVLANSIAADAILKKFDFNSFASSHKPSKAIVKSRRIKVGDSLGEFKGIVSLTSPQGKWVYFDRVFDLGVQKKILEGTGERRLSFMTDSIKTAKSLVHDSWPGAKIEMHFPGEGEIVVGRRIYGYPVVGIHQFTAFGRINGSTFSQNFELNELGVTRDSEKIKIKVSVDNKTPVKSGFKWDFYRITFDVAINQFDIDNGNVISFFGTEIKNVILAKDQSKVSVPNLSEKYSLPKFLGRDDNYGYVWHNDTLRKAKITVNEKNFDIDLVAPAQLGDNFEFPVGVEFNEKFGPIVNFL